jgi:hypothetical protein
MNIKNVSIAALVAVTFAGCDAEPADAATELRTQQDNGFQLNSAVINGTTLNGFQLNGFQLNGWQLNGWQLNGFQLNGITLSGSLFSGIITVKGKPVVKTGADFVGSEITLSKTGAYYKLRIDNITVDPANPTGDVYFYKVSVYDAVKKIWTSLCKDSEGHPVDAIPLKNAWDLQTGDRLDLPNAVTFACRGAALAKCVEWGYRPWATRQRCDGGNCVDESLVDTHQACTRMARADYCGDGTPYTFNGTPIDIYDAFDPPIQQAATFGAESWKIEAEWGPDGARCVGDDLRLKMFDDAGVEYDHPPCLDALDDFGDCGDMPAQRGAEVATRYCSVWQSDPAACELATVQAADN